MNHGWIYDNHAYINKDGYSAKFTVEYTNWILNEATQTYDDVKFEASAIGVGVDVIVSNNTMQYAVVQADEAPDSWKSDWKSNGFSVPADDQNFRIYARYKKNTDPSWANYTVATPGEFNYVSTDTDKLVIIDNYLYPAKQGAVTVLVQDPNNNNVVIGAFDIAIQANRGFAGVTVDYRNVSLGNADLGTHTETREIVATSTDTMGDPTGVTLDNIELINRPADAPSNAELITLKDIPSQGDGIMVKHTLLLKLMAQCLGLQLQDNSKSS